MKFFAVMWMIGGVAMLFRASTQSSAIVTYEVAGYIVFSFGVLFWGLAAIIEALNNRQ
jgi:hypothetical protein